MAQNLATKLMRQLAFLLMMIPMFLAACRREVPAPPLVPTETSVAPAAPASTSIPLSPALPTPTNAEDLAAGFVSPDNPLLRYIGRVDFSDATRPRFDWPATAIEAEFEGSSLTVLIDDGLNSYNVTIDGHTTVLATREGQKEYQVAQGLSSGQHSLRLAKRTETFYGTPTFLGLQLDASARLRSPTQASRRIEFVGDSITAGYGSEGQSPTCTFSRDTENVEITYAAITAERFAADYTAIAVSGLGIVRNYNFQDSLSPGTMLTYYGRTLANETAENWDFERWTPDAVVINLGTNDYSTTPHPAGELFLNGYIELIGYIRNRYPNAHIFAVAGPLMVDPAQANIRSAVTQLNTILGDQRVHFVPIENNLDLSAVDFGCDWHPNESGHRKIADQLTPAMASVLGWQ